jgi:predicted nucleotide-binding protein
LGKRNEDVTCFIIHGHDELTKRELKNYLQNNLHLPEPVILHEVAGHGRTMIEKFEHYARSVNLVFVIVSPDDKMASGDVYRVRQNVIFEMGYFYGKLGRESGRIVLLHKGGLEFPSDIAGIIYIDITNGVEAAGEMIRREVSAVINTM